MSQRRPGAGASGADDGPDAREAGIALVSALLVTLLLAALTVGFTAMVVTDTRVRSLDGTRTQAFYAAQAGLEKLTANLGDLFDTNFAPSGAQVNALMTTPPALSGVTWVQPGGANGYAVTFPADANGNPITSTLTVLSGPYQGLIGLATPYQMAVTAHLPDASEASVTRTLQTVSIPVFQFGIFSDNDLSFFAGPNFNFGGRVHTNGNLFLASGNGSTLTMSDKVTAVGEVVRTNLSNGWNTSTNYTGTVSIITAPGAYRNLGTNEGSLVGTLGSARNEPTWTNISTGTYNHNLMNGRTGATRLDLPVVSLGATPIDLIRRPAVGEDVSNPDLLDQRFFSLASLRILLSDTAAGILSLPTVTQTAPVLLGNLAVNPISGYTVSSTRPPLAISPGTGTLGVRTPTNTPLIGGYLKIEMQDQQGVWHDVTLELLKLGISDAQPANPSTGSPSCADPNPTAVIRLERLRDNDSKCLNGSTTATDYVPNVLYDAREALLRDTAASTAPMQFGGIMNFVEIDVGNLTRWFKGQIGTSGTNAMNVTGYVVYFSDRRTNRNTAGQETGEFGFEDFVNPASSSGTPNGVLDTGEDVNGNQVLDTYGETPILVSGMTAPYTSSARPWTSIDPNSQYSAAEELAIAERNPPIFFRRALKLTDGALGSIIAPGLTVAAENPAYVQGNWNANSSGFGNPHVATAVLADAVTLLSNNWSDRNSLVNAHNLASRPGTTTWYRLAVLAGKGLSFQQPSGTPQDFGTDGGTHNFLRYLEDWSGATLNYRGSIVSLFTSRQAVGTYKCCTDVYSPPTRGYNFDTDFLTPALLPPRTPMFRDINVTGFAQIIRPH